MSDNVRKDIHGKARKKVGRVALSKSDHHLPDPCLLSQAQLDVARTEIWDKEHQWGDVLL